VRSIESADGTQLWVQEEGIGTPAMDPRDAYQVTSMLQSVVDYGTGKAIRSYGVRGLVAGKTGTTNSGTDVWFVGYTPTIVAGFWFGFDNPAPISGDASADDSPPQRGPSSISMGGARTHHLRHGIRRRE